MNQFEKAIEKLQQEAKEQHTNINIGIMALNTIYNTLTAEQKTESVGAFILVLNNL